LDERKTIYIREPTHWKGAKDLESHIVIENGGILEIDSRIALPKGARITVHPKGQLKLNSTARIHNDCGEKWKGIEVLSNGKSRGGVVFVGSPSVEDIQYDITNVAAEK
jgi:hypothetical protein